jgi:hypothetical protein
MAKKVNKFSRKSTKETNKNYFLSLKARKSIAKARKCYNLQN